MPFIVRECSGYNDRAKPDWDQMEKFAINVAPISFAKKVGFRTQETERERENLQLKDDE